MFSDLVILNSGNVFIKDPERHGISIENLPEIYKGVYLASDI
jgi:hypothetical protein